MAVGRRCEEPAVIVTLVLLNEGFRMQVGRLGVKILVRGFVRSLLQLSLSVYKVTGAF